MNVQFLHGDVIQRLRGLDSESVHMVITSIPYWGLRCYGIPPSVWGGREWCEHIWGEQNRGRRKDILPSEESEAGRLGTHENQGGQNDGGLFCQLCGAWRGELGLEPTPQLYLQHIVDVFEHVRRILRNDGTLWLNIGDCYITNPHGAGSTHDPKYPGGRDRTEGRLACNRTNNPTELGLKSKDLAMIPARVALALQDEGWYLRSQIPWLKRNGMPESTMDRPVSMVEYIYLFSKSESYYYDREATIIERNGNAHSRGQGLNPKAQVNEFGSEQNASFSAAISKACGPNSRMLVDRNYDKTRRSGNTERKSRKENGGNPDHNGSSGYGIPWEGTTRRRRNTDWFFESWQGLMPDEAGDPLAMVVNPQQFSIEMCKQCKACYHQKEYRKLPLVTHREQERRTCVCGSVEWTSHFATFPEKMVTPCILSGTSEYGCCAVCGAPYERVVEKPNLGDWHPNADRGNDRTVPNGGARANLRKHDTGAINGIDKRLRSKIDPEGDQFGSKRLNENFGGGSHRERLMREANAAKWSNTDTQSSGHRMVENLKAARAAGKHTRVEGERNGDPIHTLSKVATHDYPFPIPETLGWRPTCSHPLFPAGDPVPAVVLDPFGGSGTTAVVASKLGRHAILIDASEDYLTMARFRLDLSPPKEKEATIRA